MDAKANHNITILVVDDSSFLLKAESILLEAMGYRVLTAENAYQAIQIISEQQVNLVITDYNMPYIRGDELVFLIHQRFPTLPVVVATSSEKTEIEPIKQAGVLKIFKKPLLEPQIKSLVEEVVDCN